MFIHSINSDITKIFDFNEIPPIVPTVLFSLDDLKYKCFVTPLYKSKYTTIALLQSTKFIKIKFFIGNCQKIYKLVFYYVYNFF